MIANEREWVAVGVEVADGPTLEGDLLGESATPESDSRVVLSVVVVVVVEGARAPYTDLRYTNI